MNKHRCAWAPTENQLYIDYHDTEWGVPLFEDQLLFEFLTLESFQSGLSWLTILKKRDNFRKAFSDFDPIKVSNFNQKDIDRLMEDEGIVRNLKKIESTINNAQRFLEVQAEYGSFSDYIWSFVDHNPVDNQVKSVDQVPAKTELATKISKELKKKGFKFLGPTTVYAFMQATGMVNDHEVRCFRYSQIKN